MNSRNLYKMRILCILLITIALPTVSSAAIPTDPNLKVAFIADTGYGSNFRSVLSLIKSENASAVFHQGDFDYNSDPAGFFSVVHSVLGSNYPYFAIDGNHDAPLWPTTNNPSYAKFVNDHIKLNNIKLDDPNINDEMYSFVFRGLKVVYVGQKGASIGDSTYAPFIESQLINDDHIWKIAAWHKNQQAMQIGGKSNEMGWNVYEKARQYGAIIAQGHEHSYERTKTLIDFKNQIVDPKANSPTDLHVGTNHTFAFVSGLGGFDIRSQLRCLPYTSPYGCKGEWAKIYTSNQGATYGALFIIFNYNGDPNKARGYFKNINGKVVDDFNITKDVVTQPLTPTPTPILTPIPTPIPTPIFYNNSSLQAAWKFDDNSGTIASDSSGNGNTGTLKNFDFNAKSGWTAGKTGPGLKFDGINDYVNVLDSNSIDATTLTFEAWIKYSGLDSQLTSNKKIVSKKVNWNDANGWSIEMGKGGIITVLGSGSSYNRVKVLPSWDKAWHHLVVTISGSQASIYLDGNAKGKGTVNSLKTNNINLSIGRMQGETTSYFNGTIDEVRIFNRTLTANEIIQRYSLK